MLFLLCTKTSALEPFSFICIVYVLLQFFFYDFLETKGL